jgi:hypothetical protein
MEFSQIILHTWENDVTAGSTELDNKLALYTTDYELFVFKTFYSSAALCCCGDTTSSKVFCSCCTIERHYLPDY